ncbi:MAG: AAA family ATPase [Candidatus Bathyarchaeia archaeon]
MIIFETLRYKNFLSSGNVFTVIELNKHVSTLIIGKNGSGKSTVLDALCFALFAKPFRNINKPQLVNSINKKNLLVELTFSIGTNKYKIRRGIKPVIFEVLRNGRLLNQAAEQKDYQETLEKQILKLNYKSFRQIVILGSASFIPFMALTTGQRREIIEDLLDLQIFTTMNTLLKERISLNNKDILDIIARQELIQEKIDLYNNHLAQVQKNNEDLINHKILIITDTLKSIDPLLDQISLYDVNINMFRTELEQLEDYTPKIQKLDRLEHKIQAELGVIYKDQNFFNDHENCPTCNQYIDARFRATMIEDKTKNINKITKGLEKLKQDRGRFQVYQSTRNDCITQINELTLGKKEIQNQIDLKRMYIEQVKQEIELAKQHTDEYHGEKIEELSAELKQTDNDYQLALEDKQTYASAALLLKDSGIKAKIIKQYVPVINKLINKYLSALDFFVQFELNESFEETIKSRYRDEFSYESFSEGEKKRINLAIIFTWRAVAKLRNSANTNLFMLDEVFDSSLDLTGMEDVLRLLLSLSADNTFIISHNQATMADKFANVIKFEKRQNFSKVANA